MAKLRRLNSKFLGFCMFFMLAYGCGIASFSADPISSLMLVALAWFTVAVACTPLLTRKNYEMLEAPSFFALGALIGFYFKTLYIIQGAESSYVVARVILLYQPIEVLIYGAVMLNIGMIALIIGNYVRIPRFSVPRYFRGYAFRRGRLNFMFFLFLFVAFGALLLMFVIYGADFGNPDSLSQKRFKEGGAKPSERLSNSNYYIYRLALLAKAPLYVSLYILVAEKRRMSSFVGIVFLLSAAQVFALSVFASNKSDLLITVVDCVAIAYLVSGWIDYKKVFVYVGVSIILMSFVASIRSGGAFDTFGVMDKIFGNRYFFEISRSAHIINSIPDVLEYANGLTFVAWLNLILPLDWHFDTQYFTDMGRYMASNVFGLFNSGVTPGIVPELYLNFGIVGVVVGMFLVGALLRWFHLSVFRHCYSPMVAILYVIAAVRLPAFLMNNSFNVALLKTIGDGMAIFIFMVLAGSYVRRAE